MGWTAGPWDTSPETEKAWTSDKRVLNAEPLGALICRNKQFVFLKSEEDFSGSETTLDGSMMMNTCHYTSVQTQRMYDTERQLSRKRTLGDKEVLMALPGDKGTALVSDAGREGGTCRWRGNSLYLPLLFAGNLKLPQTRKIFMF